MNLPKFTLAPSKQILKNCGRIYGCVSGTQNKDGRSRFPSTTHNKQFRHYSKLYSCVKNHSYVCKTKNVLPKPEIFFRVDYFLLLTRSVEMMHETERQKDEKEKQEKTVNSVINIMKESEDFSLTLSDEEILVSCIKHLLSIRISPEKVEKLFTRNMKIFSYPDFISTTEFLHRYGLQGKRICRLLTVHPQILDVPKDTIQTCMENLRELGFHHADILSVVERSPEIVHIEPKVVVQRVIDLKALFKSKDVLDLIKKTPNVIFDDWDTILDKFNYVFFAMGITQRQIMYSSLFKHSLRHVERRHVFLERAGFFRKWKKKTGEKNPNPELEDIIDLSDKVFVQKYGGMNQMDYDTFCCLFDKEIEEQRMEYNEETKSDEDEEECEDEEED